MVVVIDKEDVLTKIGDLLKKQARGWGVLQLGAFVVCLIPPCPHLCSHAPPPSHTPSRTSRATCSSAACHWRWLLGAGGCGQCRWHGCRLLAGWGVPLPRPADVTLASEKWRRDVLLYRVAQLTAVCPLAPHLAACGAALSLIFFAALLGTIRTLLRLSIGSYRANLKRNSPGCCEPAAWLPFWMWHGKRVLLACRWAV